ncbi:head decoration protein [Rhizobium leguminosarum]|uniref:head decoration protein n=1 Tax=Rhizobium leguminosarum TaxID=384 RepID=UPI001C95E491|nr:head decoration protein [Rhizobium leguminosarum]MBY5684832.1 head decoration protein [Rhizobium leguminosarum]
MVEFVEKNHDEEFLFTEANGTLSRATITLEQSARVYQPGDIVILISGTYVLATNALVDANVDADVSIVARRTNATAKDTKAAAIVRDAEVKAGYLTFGASTVLADLSPSLAEKNIIVLPDAA